MRIELCLLRWKIKARYRMRAIWKHAIRFWHWSAKWPWFTALFLGALGVITVSEYALSILLLSLSALGVLAKILHWDGSGIPQGWMHFLKGVGSTGTCILLVTFVYIVVAEKGDGPWSHLSRPMINLMGRSEAPPPPAPISYSQPLPPFWYTTTMPDEGKVKPVRPGIKEPLPFREKPSQMLTMLCGKATFNFMGTMVTSGYYYPLRLGGFQPIEIYKVGDAFYVDIKLSPGKNQPPVEITRNAFKVNNPNWDRNFISRAFEVVDEHENVMFQMIVERNGLVSIKGIFSSPNGGVFVSDDNNCYMAPNLQGPVRITKIFRYPSWKYLHQYAE